MNFKLFQVQKLQFVTNTRVIIAKRLQLCNLFCNIFFIFSFFGAFANKPVYENLINVEYAMTYLKIITGIWWNNMLYLYIVYLIVYILNLTLTENIDA